jgi:hypothetical protein
VSYCRWSPDSDVYSYGDGDVGTTNVWTTHVNDGHGFTDYTLADFKARLLQLRALGHRVPDCALARIDEELAQVQNSGEGSN